MVSHGQFWETLQDVGWFSWSWLQLLPLR
jgi:hypothetical protein